MVRYMSFEEMVFSLPYSLLFLPCLNSSFLYTILLFISFANCNIFCSFTNSSIILKLENLCIWFTEQKENDTEKQNVSFKLSFSFFIHSPFLTHAELFPPLPPIFICFISIHITTIHFLSKLYY